MKYLFHNIYFGWKGANFAFKKINHKNATCNLCYGARQKKGGKHFMNRETYPLQPKNNKLDCDTQTIKRS